MVTVGRKEIRQKQLLQLILERGGVPPTAKLAEVFEVTQRTIQNDLNDIEALIPRAAVDDIHKLLVLRLRQRVPEMEDRDLLKLAEFFLSKKSEQTVRTESTHTINVLYDQDMKDEPPDQV